MLVCAGADELFPGGGLSGPGITALHKMVAILSGQVVPQDNAREFILLREQVGHIDTGNRRLCAEPPGPFGTPMHCWLTCTEPLPCKQVYDGADNATYVMANVAVFREVPVVDKQQGGGADKVNWAVGSGPALDIRSETNELHLASTPLPNAKVYLANGAPTPWTAVYVKGRGR